MFGLSESNWLVNIWIIRIIRVIILTLGWSSFIINIALSGDIALLFSTYTMQSNFMVIIWMSSAIIFQEKNSDRPLFSGLIHGAITLYITVTFIIFAILLAPMYHPTGIGAYTNLSLHYLVPIAFIIDWVLTEMPHEYKWKYILIWLVYPLLYLAFTLVRGAITNNYIYPFLDVNAFGVPIFTAICFALAGFFLGLGALYVFINRNVINHRK